jgi:hypothetical protein
MAISRASNVSTSDCLLKPYTRQWLLLAAGWRRWGKEAAASIVETPDEAQSNMAGALTFANNL